MMKKPQKDLLKKYLSGSCTSEERVWVEKWYQEYSESMRANPDSETQNIEDESGIRMWAEIHKRTDERAVRRNASFVRPQLLKIASVLVVFLLAGYLWYANFYAASTAVEIPSGKMAATIQLNDQGEGVYLDSAFKAGKMKELGIDVREEDGKIFYAFVEEIFEKYTISTKKGEEIQIILPDQTKVWINSSSKISFDSDFNKGHIRRISLDGEAYFEVAHQADRPFTIQAKTNMIEVLGTSFNVYAYGDHARTETTLIEGTVRLDGEVLAPGQQAVFDGESVKVSNVDVQDFLAWKNGYFNFSGVGIHKIIEQLENWYNIEFVLEGQLNQERIHGTIPKYQDLNSVLTILEKAGMGKFKIDGRRVIVMS